MDNFSDILFGIVANFGNYKERVVANNTIGDITLDTAYTFDAGYETAIWRGDNPKIICERYPSKEEAKRGHLRWVDTVCEWVDNNTIPETVWSVQMDCHEPL